MINQRTFLILGLAALCSCRTAAPSGGIHISGPLPSEEKVLSLSASDRDRSILNFSREGFLPVTRAGRPVSESRDLDGDGLPEAVALMVRVGSSEDARFSGLSDYSRLYRDSGDSLPDYRVAVFRQIGGSLKLSTMIDLRNHGILHQFSLFPLGKGAGIPCTVQTVFLTPEGQIFEWSILLSPERWTRYDFSETPRKRPFVTDFDRDGWVDLVIMENLLIDGGESETLMTIHRWDGDVYRPEKPLGLLDRLRSYMKETGLAMERGEWSELRYSLFSPGDRPLRGSQGDLTRLYLCVDPNSELQQEGQRALAEGKIDRVFFPEPAENPFIFEEGKGFFFDGILRIQFKERGIFLYRFRLALRPGGQSIPLFYFPGVSG